MSSLVSILFFVTFLVAMDVQSGYCRILPDIPVEIPKNSTPCSIQVNETCSFLEEDSGNYSMELNVDSFRRLREIQVKISMTHCPWHTTLSPWWYQLEVMKGRSTGSAASRHGQADAAITGRFQTPISEVGLDTALKITSGYGTFQVVHHNREIQLCNNHSTVVFTSCSPTPLDFPISFYWKGSADFEESTLICFRLTLQHDGEASCKWKEVCHSIADMPTNTSHTLDDEVETVLEGMHYMESMQILNDETIFERDGENGKHVNKDMSNFLDNQQQFRDIPSEGGCNIIQEFLHENHFSWVPACDCHGYYKKVQCDKAAGDQHTCWCSSGGGSEEAFTRMTLNCNNISKFKC